MIQLLVVHSALLLDLVWFHPRTSPAAPRRWFERLVRRAIHSPMTSNRERFRLDNAAMECLAVYAVHKASPQIIKDAESADRDPTSPFNYFLISQREYIKSIAAIPLPKISATDDKIYVLVLDTDRNGFFRPECGELYETVVSNLACRLYYELNAENLYRCRQDQGGDLWDSLNSDK